MKTRAKIGPPGSDSHYILGIAGQILDRDGTPVGRYAPKPNSDIRQGSKVGYSITGSFHDGRTFTGSMTYQPGVIGNTHEGTLTISDKRAPSFRRNAPIMVWKNHATNVTRALVQAYSGWHEFISMPHEPFKGPLNRVLAFNPMPDWGERIPIAKLKLADQEFFRAYAAAAHR